MSKRPSLPIRRYVSQSSAIFTIFQLITIFCCLTWFIAVLKVFFFEDWKLNSELSSYIDISYDQLSKDASSIASEEKIHSTTSRKRTFKRKLPEIKLSSVTSKLDKKFNEWKYDRNVPKVLSRIQNSNEINNNDSNKDSNKDTQYNQSEKFVVKKSMDRPGLKPAYELEWPPVQQDGTIPENEGTDTMPLTGLKVPRFWEAPEGADINTIGTKVNGEETIFLMIASYRDFQCRETITSAFNKADHPERLFVGAVDQVVPGDIGCLDVDPPCSVDPNQPVCKYRDQISVYKMDAKFATGPVTARHVGDRMYRGQYFVMQMDAHCLFVRHWDTSIINQWKSTGNEMAVLSSYLTDVQGSIDSNGDSTRNTRPIMCNSDFEGIMPARYLRHGSQPEEVPIIRDMPQLEPFWAAGFSFSRGHFKYRVPYDGYQPMVFQGEEIAIGIRGFTYGYDFYAPKESVVFHEYADNSKRRKKIPMFWENSVKHQGEGQKSLRRATGIIGMAPDIDPSTWDHTEEQRYGLGTVRPLSLFYKLFLINPKDRVAVQLCPLVRSGRLHKEFQKFLRPDGLGIDYSRLSDFDSRAVIASLNFQ